MVDTTIYRWGGGSLAVEDWCDPNPGAVRVADSFLVVDGGAVEVDSHFARFLSGIRSQRIEVDLDGFFPSVVAAIPREGRWFPRLEVVDYGNGALVRVLVRPAPKALDTATLETAATDPRTTPHIKGPDLFALGELRRSSSADEVVLLSDGVLAEGGWSSIVWWKDDRLHVVGSDIPRLASVTESVVVDHARYIGAPITEARVTPTDLSGAEVWILSALHGIRVATEWAGGPELHTEAGRADYWRQQYANRRKPI